jgi:glutaminyl-tRNA synthetase
VLDPLKLIIDNFPEDETVECSAPVHPHHPARRTHFPDQRELWIERDDFMETPPKGYLPAVPGQQGRLRYGYVVECTGADKDENGKVIAVHCNYFPDSKSGTEGANSYKVKGNIHWVSAGHARAGRSALYDRLFKEPQPDAGGRDFLEALNPQIRSAWSTPTWNQAHANALPEQRFQFERHGYFVADRVDSQPGKPVFNRITTLKDSWGGKGA